MDTVPSPQVVETYDAPAVVVLLPKLEKPEYWQLRILAFLRRELEAMSHGTAFLTVCAVPNVEDPEGNGTQIQVVRPVLPKPGDKRWIKKDCLNCNLYAECITRITTRKPVDWTCFVPR